MHTSLVDISNAVNHSPSKDDVSYLLSRSRTTVHFGRVATADCHDPDAWTRERNAHDTELNAVATSFSLNANGTAPDKHFSVEVTRSPFAPMGPKSEPRSVNACWLEADTAVRPYDWTSLVTPGFGASSVPPSTSIDFCSHEGLSEGRRRVGEILVRCGVIDVSGTSPTRPAAVRCGHDSDGCPIDRGLLIASLTDWASHWVYTLVIQPYLQGNFRFQYQGVPSRASTSVALRIRRILNEVDNPIQVAIHALWFIGMLTGNGAHDNASFLSIPIFRYLHDNGTFIAEDFMFRTFVTCAMISDKTVNDASLSTNSWNRLTRIPHVVLNATEKYALGCLGWNVAMSRDQWHDTIIYLRSCIKMGSAFDPFAYDGTSPSGVMARCLDELIDVSYAQQEVPAVEFVAPPHTRDSTRQVSSYTAEWCPEGDPVVNQKPRIIGIAPGADKIPSTLKVGTTAKDLLDSILGSSNIPDLAHLAQPAGTSFCGSFGIIGARLAHTIRIASACQSASWVPSHG